MKGFESNQEAIENNKKPERLKLKNALEMEEYLSWKNNVPISIQKIVESAMLGGKLPESFFEDIKLPKTKNFLIAFDTVIRRNLDRKEEDDVEQSGVGETDDFSQKIIQSIEKIKTREGFINLFQTLTDPEISWSLKEKLYNSQLKSIYSWLIDKDIDDEMKRIDELNKKETQERKQKQTEDETQPDDSKENENNTEDDIPTSSDEAKSSMESGVEKKEGSPKALFTVSPFYGGYAKSHIYTKFDGDSLRFVPKERKLTPLEKNESGVDQSLSRVMFGKIRGGEALPIPMYYDFSILPQTLVFDQNNVRGHFLINEDGITHLLVEQDGVFDYKFVVARNSGEVPYNSKAKVENMDINGSLPKDILEKIKELKSEKLPPMKYARELVKFIRDSLIYSNSKLAWDRYVKDPQKFFKNVWENKEADCFVANTLAVMTLKQAGLICRFITGHSVKDKDKNGNAIMHSGSGHAWLEVFDTIGRKWIRLDATAKGDPTSDEDQQEKDLSDQTEDQNNEGDYDNGESKSEIIGKKKLQKMIADSKTKEKKKMSQSFNIEETDFAKLAECTPAQAKEFLTALDRVREIKDENNQSISELLIREWRKIITERKIEKREYSGPVRMDEGEILDDPVEAFIDIKSKESNPTGFEKEYIIEKKESDFGGLNLYFSFDLSGSMRNPDDVSGRPKSDVQRDIALLFIDSLMQCAFVYRSDAGDTDLLPMKIMATVASSIGKVKLPLTDKWGPKEQWALYSSLNQLASGGTPTHETLALIEKSFLEEQKSLEKKKIPKDKMPIDYVVEVSDGVPDDLTQTLVMHDRLKGINVALRAYLVGGNQIEREEYTSLKSFSDLSTTMARDILEQFKKLRPKRVRF